MKINRILPTLAQVESTNGKLFVNEVRIRWIDWKVKRYSKMRARFSKYASK